MAPPPQPDHAAALQSILASIGVLTVAQLVNLFNTYGAATGFSGLLHTAVPEIVGQHAQAAATVTAQWYDELAPDLPFKATPVTDLPPERISKSIDWALHAPTKHVEAPVTEPPADVALSRLAGSAKRMVYDASRDTVIQNAKEEGVKWARYASSTACEFCRLLALRGAVYATKQSALKGHDHCRCLAVPQRPGETYTPPPYVADWQKQYEEARNAGNYGFKNILAHMRANASLIPTA
jgi:hypothetical protein